MELKISHWVGMSFGVAILIVSLMFMKSGLFFFMLWFGVLVGVSPFVFSTMQKTKIATEKEELFLEFTRNLVESVKTGTPISKSIVNMKKKPFGVLSRHVEKLANQISLGIPLKTALQTFADDINNATISRTITLIGQAEKAGGNIGEILEAVAKAVSIADKLKKERKSTISTLVAQGYIIFFVFLVIVIVMQFYIIPMLSGISSVGNLGAAGTGGIGGVAAGADTTAGDVSKSFLYLLIIQGFFSGLTIGKLSEGSIKSGIKHSFSMVVLSFLVSTIANVLFGGK
jgi:archaeal flagellar protein FlaJ